MTATGGGTTGGSSGVSMVGLGPGPGGGLIHRTYSGMSSRANSVKGNSNYGGSEKGNGVNLWTIPPSPHGNGR